MNEEILNLLKAISSDVSAFRVETKERFNRMENDVAELKGDVAELKRDVSGLKISVSRLEKTVERLEKKVDRVEQQGAAIGFELKDDLKRTNSRVNQFEPEFLATRIKR